MKQIKDTQYAIDEYGNVFNTKRGTQCTPWFENNSRYMLVGLYKGGKRTCYRVHRLVAEAYLENPNGYSFVKHLYDDKTNNHVSNLEWGENPDNVQEGYDNGCYLYNKRSYKVLVKNTETEESFVFKSMREAEDKTKINRKTMSAVLKGRRNNPEGWEISYVG